MYYIIKDLFSRHWALQNNFSLVRASLTWAPRFAGHSPGSGQAAVHFTREGYTWAGSNPVPLWCPEEAG
ncbi:unnamed protein product [Brassica oleracea]